MIKFFLLFFLFTNIFNHAFANISSAAQKNLINNNIIYTGISCGEIVSLLGGEKSLNLFWLGNKEEVENSYVLINSNDFVDYKIFYICEKKRNTYDYSNSVFELLSDQDLIKTYDNPNDLFTFIFSITSQSSIQYIMSRLQSEKFYNIDKNSLSLALAKSKKLNNKVKETRTVKKQSTPKIKKKKASTLKVESPKQEEFTPKETNQDNDAPIIEIAEIITVNDSNYEFQGKVTDQSKTIYVEVDGRLVHVNKNGLFMVKGYSPVDKKISIDAIDKWGNKSKTKTITITINQKNIDVAENLETLNPSKIKSKHYNNKVALIIGIEKYEQSPNASFANLDAKYFFDYARKAFGVKKNNIKILIDEDASLSKTNSAIFKWLPAKIKPNQTDLIIFFSGHGLASSDGKEKYILPSNADPDLLSKTALSRTELFDEIIRLKPKSVTMFFDTCYSGISRDEKTLLASAKPLRIVSNNDKEVPENFTIFTASKVDQISSSFKEAKHGIFSYYLMKGLEGDADTNKDKNITNGEMLAYMDQKILDRALAIGRQQNPMLSGDPNKILMSYR
tara:strand:- start:3 stop:1688 length:1686 start_codon:yes stop_codon:yes gene_type:complete